MHCPFCGHDDTKVNDSRLSNEGSAVRRRRECLSCFERFTTFEKAQLVLPRVIKRDDNRVPFSEDKLRSGILRALEKRPVETEDIENSISKIMKRARSCGDREIEAATIGEWVINELRDLDQVAYVRFASVYRSFQDVSAFEDEIEKLKQVPTGDTKKRQFSLLPSEDDENA